MEFTGVRRLSSRRVNQLGIKLSQPAVIGRRVNPVNRRLAAATARAITRKMPNCAAQPADSPKAARMVCGIGPITLTGPCRKASTELVPRMNISEMMGAEIITDWPMVRAALRHSPAMMATYSKPLSAPTAICPKIATPNQLTAGLPRNRLVLRRAAQQRPGAGPAGSHRRRHATRGIVKIVCPPAISVQFFSMSASLAPASAARASFTFLSNSASSSCRLSIFGGW